MTARKIYINEIIRITYKCNWKCKFCNVLKTNNFGDKDISNKEIIYQILNLLNKYNFKQRKSLVLSFSGGEPTLNNNLLKYIKLAKEIGIGNVQLQTNGTLLFKNKRFINELINNGLNQIFLAQHSSNSLINKKLGIFYNQNDFKSWVNFIKINKLNKKIQISFNIVINKVNIYQIYEYIKSLIKMGFINLLPSENNNSFFNTKRISIGLVQPNGYADINRQTVLLKFNKNEIKEIKRIVTLCKDNNIYPDFHFTAPPLCILFFPNYNLEYQRLKLLERDKKNGKINKNNLNSYKGLWKEKIKIKKCNDCKYNNYCLGFYKNWANFVGKKYIFNKVYNFIKSYKS